MRLRLLLPGLLAICCARAEESLTPMAILAHTLSNIVEIVEPSGEAAARSFSTRLQFNKSEGIGEKYATSTVAVAVQAPDRLLISGTIGKDAFRLARNGQQLWAYVPGKRFAVVGEPGQPRFLSAPEKKDDAQLEPLRLPLPREQIALLPFLMDLKALTPEELRGNACHVLDARA